MSLTSGIRRGLGVEQRSWTLKEPPDWLWDVWGGARSTAGPSVTADSTLGVTAAFAAVRLLSGCMALCPLVVYRGTGPTGTGAGAERATGSPRYKLLHDRPNTEHSPDIWTELIGAHGNLWGNAYHEKVKAGSSGRTIVGELWPLPPNKVRVTRDSKQRKVFEVEGNARSFGTDKILHIPSFGYDGLKGLSPISIAREAIGSALAMQEFLSRNIGNGGTPASVIELPEGQEMGEQAQRAFIAAWKGEYGGLDNVGKFAILEDGATLKTVAPHLKDLEFVAHNRFSVNQIARLFLVPPEMIGGDRDSSMTYSTVEGQALHFVKYSLARWLKRAEGALRFDADLFPDGVNEYPEFLVEGLLRGASKERAEFYEIMHRIKALMSDEIRERENLPPLTDEQKEELKPPAPPAPPPEQEPQAPPAPAPEPPPEP